MTPTILETAIGRTPNNWFGWVAGAGAEARVGRQTIDVVRGGLSYKY